LDVERLLAKAFGVESSATA